MRMTATIFAATAPARIALLSAAVGGAARGWPQRGQAPARGGTGAAHSAHVAGSI